MQAGARVHINMHITCLLIYNGARRVCKLLFTQIVYCRCNLFLHLSMNIKNIIMAAGYQTIYIHYI